MWNRNLDTGKWVQQVDTLPKDRYESLKIDLEKVKLYSKCLSGATYLTINNFDDLYSDLSDKNIGFHFGLDRQFNGPSIPITQNNSDEFYNKYLSEYAFTIKNLFTPEKLIKSEGQNSITVDLATTEAIEFKPSTSIFIDGIQLRKGNRILVKDQKKIVTVGSSDIENYFTNILPVSTIFLLQDDGTSKTYEYFDNRNGIYEYDGTSLVKLNIFDEYYKVRKLIVTVKFGEKNADKQYNLQKLKTGYYPIGGQNFEFKESENWVLRNRVDYNNIFDLNFYDILTHGPQNVFDKITNMTYSIPERVISVGEFGSIINNQDKISLTATYSISNIISNKYKVNLRSIVEVDNYYWICGDEGTLLKASKIDFSLEKIDLGEDLNFTSVSFINNLYGVVVGKFNRIYFTKNGGFTWARLQFDEFDAFSYNIVQYITIYNFIVGGENGVLLEFTLVNGIWTAIKRNVTKYLGEYNQFNLVEDINDIDYTSWYTVKPFDFFAGLTFTAILSDGYRQMEFDFDKVYYDSETYSIDSESYISFSFSSPNGNFYTSNKYGIEDQNPKPQILLYDMFRYTYENSFSELIEDKRKGSIPLPLGDDGNIIKGSYTFDIHHISNYDQSIDNIVPTYSYYQRYTFQTVDGSFILIGGNNQSVICYDLNQLFTPIGNNFIFASFTQSSIGDVRSIEKKKDTPDIYISGDKIYRFNFGSFNKFSDRTTNQSVGGLILVDNIFANKITNSTHSIYLAGNNSVLKKRNLSIDTSFNDLDPSFNSRLKSRFLILDYDIGSKLNFFDDDGVYRLPDSVTIPLNNFNLSNSTFNIKSLDNEFSWIDYYKDTEKSFQLGTQFSEAFVVKFQSQFVNKKTSVGEDKSAKFTINTTKIAISGTTKSTRVANFTFTDAGKIYYLIPGIEDPQSSEFKSSSLSEGTLPPNLVTSYDLFLYKNIAVFKRTFSTTNTQERRLVEDYEIGDVLYFTSDVVDTKLMINRIEYYGYLPGNSVGNRLSGKPADYVAYSKVDIYLYTISNFNENIINNLKRTTSAINVVNLNQFFDVDKLIENFNRHPIGLGYKLSKSGTDLKIECLFNEKTAYYNLQAQVYISGIPPVTKLLKYKESFMNFGYSPTYNIFSYLNKINPQIFNSNKEFTVMPALYSLPGNAGQGFNKSNVYIDSGLKSASQSNTLFFGSDLKLQWDGFLPNTFIDLNANSLDNKQFSFPQIMITEKYYREDLDAYVLEFDKKLTINEQIRNFDLISRRNLTQISQDLQLLNNIQKSQSTKNIQGSIDNSTTVTFLNFENYIRTKFNTESYLKILVSDYDIRQNLSAILYTDSEFQIAMNVLNLESQLQFKIRNPITVPLDVGYNKLGFTVEGLDEKLKAGDLVFVTFDGVDYSPRIGLQTVIDPGPRGSNFIITSMDFTIDPNFPDDIIGKDGTMTFIKKDPFFNYQPVDIFRKGSDSKVTRSVEVLPTNYKLQGLSYSLVNLDMNKYKLQLVDGLSLEELNQLYHWILEAEVSDALLGKDNNGLVWYSGKWRCGRWFGGTWYSGEWLTGDWYKGTWNAFRVINKTVSAKVDSSYSSPNISKWYNGRWFEGTWNDGTWYNGRRYNGDWKSGLWYNGVWNDGNWMKGFFYGGIWVNGTWESGTFNCDSKPAYWLDGTFKTGDFENGMWYNGFFGNDRKVTTRFGTRASNTRTATWHGGIWIDGEFHSSLNRDSDGNSITSDIHKYSVWYTGIWSKGNWYGGIAFNIDFRGGTWHGGILEEIQVIGIDSILPAETSNNKIYLNGIFKFNVGDEIWIIDDNRNVKYSFIGNNKIPRKYRINKVVEDPITKSTGLFLNYNLSTLTYSTTVAADLLKNFTVAANPDLDLGIRVVSKFYDITWKSGIWTNGIFENGKFDSGMWYNGIFTGTWGN